MVMAEMSTSVCNFIIPPISEVPDALRLGGDFQEIIDDLLNQARSGLLNVSHLP